MVSKPSDEAMAYWNAAEAQEKLQRDRLKSELDYDRDAWTIVACSEEFEMEIDPGHLAAMDTAVEEFKERHRAARERERRESHYDRD